MAANPLSAGGNDAWIQIKLKETPRTSTWNPLITGCFGTGGEPWPMWIIHSEMQFSS